MIRLVETLGEVLGAREPPVRMLLRTLLRQLLQLLLRLDASAQSGGGQWTAGGDW